MLWDRLKDRGLSNREVEVAQMVGKGLRNKEVAQSLFIEEKTVKFHLTNIYKKLNLKSRSQLIVWCAPHMNFQEKTEPAGVAQEEIEYTMPVGRQKVGSA